ncbi:MAG TPA: hypothetical protein DIV41_05440 [Ruminococcaceae bacterium]|jgi:hypothetical protein|nr:hypothetical protein [Oscillospiraceae bacterium]
MDIKHLSDIEYKYIFNINDIIEAREICNQRNDIVKESDVPNEIKNSINERSNDINSLLCKVIDKIDLNNSDDYDNVLNAAIIANSDIQILIKTCLLKGKLGEISKKNPLYNDFCKWQNINIRLGAKSLLYIWNENHSTTVAFCELFLSAIVIILIAIISKNTIGIIIGGIAFAALFVMWGFIYSKRIKEFSDIDYLNRIKNSLQYKSKTVLKSTQKELLNLFGNVLNLTKKI